MFKIPRVNVIESDEGFSVEIISRTDLRYTQGDKTLIVDSEILASTSPFFLVIFPDSIQSWDPPHEGEPIDKATRKSIIDNICRAFAFKGQRIKVHDIYETLHGA
jgi:hypothetical protein